MTTSLPSLMSRKKKIPGYSGLRSEKVLADYTPNSKCPKSFYQETFLGQKKSDNKTNKPAGKVSTDNPNQVSFIYENPRFLNEPICFANTLDTRKEQKHWWQNSVPLEKKHALKYSTSTVNRSDYKAVENKDRPKRLSRFGCNKQKNLFARGILPGYHEGSMISKEKISYGHQFNCRQGRRERGCLHGAFVWEPVTNSQLCERIRERLTDNKTCIY